MDVRALLFGSTLRIAVTVVAGFALAVGGAFFAGALGVPSVEQVDNRFGAVDDTRTEIETDVVVHNPNPVGVRLGDTSVNYTVSMNDVEMAQGSKDGVGIGAGNSTVNLTTDLRNERIPPWWVSHVRNGERTDLSVTATAHSGLVGRSATFQAADRTIETDLIGQFNSSEDRPVNADMALVDDPVAIIRQTNASWGTVTEEETPIELEFGVYNPKASPLVVSNIGYNITMNGVPVGDGETAETESIPGKTYRVVETPTAIDNQNLDEWWVTHVENDQTTELRIDFYAEIEPPGSSETIRVPLEDLTYTRTIETDMFGTKGETNAGAGGDTDGSETTTESGTTREESTTNGTTSDETTTEDSTTTEESSTTESGTTDDSTTTDDGLLPRVARA
ncbi:LEA type 2 family protein [Halobacterium sp. R2-5]|uniref:LEA type 2 family protein n=1 Tax=Halobacterium sp. R2-5 TaxID=2715751 RepID=UPI00142023A9|nr:LEA type 2 family protein [Halobacterium sp. R2-5]NIB99096.1 hypothetical protein [Halobacterium sp. R2-5]